MMSEAVNYTKAGIKSQNKKDKILTTAVGYVPIIGSGLGAISEQVRKANLRKDPDLTAKDFGEILANTLITKGLSKSKKGMGAIGTKDAHGIMEYKAEEKYGVNYNTGPNVRGNDDGNPHFVVKPGDTKMVYDAYENGKFSGQYEVYIRDGEIERLWYYQN